MVLGLAAVITSYSNYRDMAFMVRSDLDNALQKTIAHKGIERMRQDSIRAYNMLAGGGDGTVTIVTDDEVLRRHLKISRLREKAYLAYDITRRGGELEVDFRSDAACSAFMLWGLSDQRLPVLLGTMALLSLAFSARRVHREAALQHDTYGGIWLDEADGRFKTAGNAQLPLTPMQQQLMEMFFAADGHTLTKQAICSRLWPKKPDASDTLYTLVRRLKPVIEAHSSTKIESDRGRSYSLRDSGVG